MIVLPAIDVRNGRCVRLLQGDYARQIDYRDDPAAQALDFEAAGADWLHVVDLDGARDGHSYNFKTLLAIRQKTRLHLEVGGGIRTAQTVQMLLQTGIDRVILGTAALEEPDWFARLVGDYPRQIVLGLDARRGLLATRGWTACTDTTAEVIIQEVNAWPLAAIIYTDISRDGMLSGPNIEAVRQLAQVCRIPLIASGGVSQLADVAALAQLPIAGMIIGRALYEGKFTLQQALQTLNYRA